MEQNNRLHEGVTLYNQKKYSDALAFFLGLPEDSSIDNIELAYFIGLCHTKLQRYDDALLYLEQVVTSGKNIDRVLQCRFLLAVIYAISGRRRLANFELEKLLETGYKTASVYAAIAFVSWEQKDTERCLDYYKKSLESDSENISALNGLGYVLATQDKDLTQALGFCKKAVEYSPDSGACLDSLGYVYYKLGLFKEAKKYLQKAEKKLPDSEEIKEHLRLLKEVEQKR
ncbi:MAG: tetratricopeptide repeat protein [Treponema sp.]|uniref:tetratricopeptide repeat protein n=1 Tax=Treponema sp. TaxID=166 RepID=UPI00298D689E|nr:tetratricopeptide repeat protein [Treponema sp.]MBR5932951.1 tetratricopeptide repeat protein [Treponema sp.]